MILLSSQGPEIVRFFLPDHCMGYEKGLLLLKFLETTTMFTMDEMVNDVFERSDTFLKYRAIKKYISI